MAAISKTAWTRVGHMRAYVLARSDHLTGSYAVEFKQRGDKEWRQYRADTIHQAGNSYRAIAFDWED